MITTVKEIIFGALLSIVTFFAPSFALVLLVYAFIFVDIAMARYRVAKQRKQGKPVKWNSRSFIKGFAPKIILYTTVILLFHALDTILLNQFVKFIVPIELLSTKIIAGGLIYAELRSISESWKVVFGKSLLRYILDVLNFSKSIKDKFDDINKDKEL
jgi:hypothetical protein